MRFSRCMSAQLGVLSLKKLGSNLDLVRSEVNMLSLHSRRAAPTWLCSIPGKNRHLLAASHDADAVAKLCRAGSSSGRARPHDGGSV